MNKRAVNYINRINYKMCRLHSFKLTKTPFKMYLVTLKLSLSPIKCERTL